MVLRRHPVVGPALHLQPLLQPRSSTACCEPIANSTQRRNGDERSINYIGKLTYLISSDHRVSLTVTGTPTTGGGDGGVALRNRSTNRTPFNADAADPGHLQLHLRPSRASTRSTSPASSTAPSSTSGCCSTCSSASHIQRDSYLPGDGSRLDDIDNPAVLAGVPQVRSPAGRPHAGLPARHLGARSVPQACTRARSDLQRGALLHRWPGRAHRDAGLRQLPGAARC